LIFVLISIFELARGMWLYHTLAYAVKEGVRYAIVHGQNCTVLPNNCPITVQQIVTRIQQSGVGLVPDQLAVKLESPPGTVTVDCTPDLVTSGCWTNAANWPVYPNNQLGSNIKISGSYPFQSAIAMLWPGAKGSIQFGKFTFTASSEEAIQF
jgi:hypothetical protein